MRGKKKAGYGNVYKDIMSNPNLSLQSKGLYGYLSSFTGDQAYCFPSYDRMQEQLNLSRTSISKYLKELIGFGVVQVNKRFSGTNQYYLTDLGDFKHEDNEDSPECELKEDAPIVQNMNRDSSDNELPIVQNMNSIKNTSLRTDKKNTYPDDFIHFWNQYHKITASKKGPKDAALKHWKKLNKSDKAKALEMIGPYSKTVSESKYIAYARTYLADKRFNDEYETTPSPKQFFVYKLGNETKKHQDAKRWARDMRNYQGNGYVPISIPQL